MSHTFKVRVGKLRLADPHEVEIPQEYAAYHERVRVPPGEYDIYAYVHWIDGGNRVRHLSAQCAGVCLRNYYGAQRSNDLVGQTRPAYIELPTYGLVGEAEALIASSTLCDALDRHEWDPREHDLDSTTPRMWRFQWNPAREFRIDAGQATHSGSTLAATLTDHESAAGFACHEGPDGLCTGCGVEMMLCSVCRGVGYHRSGCEAAQ